MEREPEDAKGGRVADLAVGSGHDDGRVRGAARADHELPDAMRAAKYTGRGLRGKALVDVVVAAQDDVGARGIELIPERLHDCLRMAARAEARDVHVRKRALGRVGG